MKKISLITLAVILACKTVLAQDYIPNAFGDYLGEKYPEDSAIIFAPEIISLENRYEYALAISPSHDEIFYTAEGAESEPQLNGLMRIKRNDDRWYKPQIANLNGKELWEQEAFFSTDGSTIYYAVAHNDSVQIWTSVLGKDSWEKGSKLISPINHSTKILFYATLSNNGNIYFTDVIKRKIFMSPIENGKYSNIIDIGIEKGGHGFIAQDESFILLDALGDDSYGKRDIYVSFKSTKDGKWSMPINLGTKVNSEYSETCPSLSPDGKFLFFSRYNEINDKSDIYWISSKIIYDLKP